MSRAVPGIVSKSTALGWAFALAACGPAEITVDPGTRFQTIEGWGATAEMGDWDLPRAEVNAYRAEVLDWLVDSMGVSRIRINLRSGYEHPEDLVPGYLEDVARRDYSRRELFHERRFLIVNDNEDPYVANLDGFQFFSLDLLMRDVVLPIEERLRRKGEQLHLTATYVDFGVSDFEHRDNPEEFGEYMLVMFEHFERTYGRVPDAIEINEPDNDGYWSAEDVGRAFVAAGRRLEEAGYTPEFGGPTTINIQLAPIYLEAMLAVPGVKRFLREFSYHTYNDPAPERDRRRIAQLGAAHGLRIKMGEYMFGTHADLHADLTLANASAWEKFGILDYMRVENGLVSYRDDSAYLAQYFRNIPRGSVRLAASSSRRSVEPAAFVRPDGSYVVVVRAPKGGRFVVRGLPAGEYEVVYTTGTADVTAPAVLTTNEDGSVLGKLSAAGLAVVRSRQLR